jgi:small subunit ribosomal protein S19e
LKGIAIFLKELLFQMYIKMVDGNKEAQAQEQPKVAEEKSTDSGRMNPLSVNPSKLIELMAKELRKLPEMKAPEWTAFVKTGMHKERPPQREDWWYVRAASILRNIARLGPVGTSKLRTKYGGKQDRGHRPEKFARGSGSIARKAMMQLEKAGLVKQATKGIHKGRIITKEGSQMLEENSKKASVKNGQ